MNTMQTKLSSAGQAMIRRGGERNLRLAVCIMEFPILDSEVISKL